MLSLFKASTYKLGERVFSLDGAILPKKYWHRKSYGVNLEKLHSSFAQEYGGVVRSIRVVTDLLEIEDFLLEAHDHPELMCIYSGVRKTYLRQMFDAKLMRPTKEFFCVDGTKTNIVAIDIDNWLVEGLDCTDTIACGKYIYNLLHTSAPEIFPKDGGYVIKASSSAGIKQGLNYHMFFINESEIQHAQIKTVVRQILNPRIGNGFVDPSVYSPGRLWYAAKPRFLDPSKYPFIAKKFLHVQHGRTITIDPTIELDLPKDLSKVDVDLIRNQFRNFTGIEPTREDLYDPIARILEQIEAGIIQDNMWSKHALHIIFLAISYGYDLECFIEKILRPALTKYANDKHVPVDRYLSKVDFALKYATSTVTREITKENLESRKILKHLDLITVETVAPTDEGYLDLQKPFPKKFTLNFIKASLGTGKTTAVKNLIEDGTLKNVISITNRVSLVNSNARKLGLVSYQEMGTFESSLNSTGLSVCLNSLARKDIAENIFQNKYKTLFIDEADSVMYDLINASTITDIKREEILNCLQHLLDNCDNVILADGDMSCETIEAYCQLSTKHANVYITQTQTHSGVKVYEYLRETEMHGALISEIENNMQLGGATLVVSDYGPAKIRELVYIIEGQLREIGHPIRTLQIHDESKNDDDVRALLLNPTAPMDYDLVFTSPSVTSGIDFQGKFSSVFCYTTNKVNTPNIRLQAICRERKPQNIHIHTGTLVESKWVSEKYYEGYNKRAQGFIEKTRAEYIHRDLLECEKYRFYIRYNMLSKGVESYEICPRSEELTEVWNMCRIKFKEEHLSIYISNILKANVNQELKTMNKIGHIKKEILAYTGVSEDELTYEMVEQHLKDKPAVKAKNLYAMAKITKLWNELTLLKSNKVDLNKEKTLVDMFLRHLPEIKKAGAFVNLEYPLSTLRSLGFIPIVGPSKRLQTWDDTTAIENYLILVNLLELDTLDESIAIERLEVVEELSDLDLQN